MDRWGIKDESFLLAAIKGVLVGRSKRSMVRRRRRRRRRRFLKSRKSPLIIFLFPL